MIELSAGSLEQAVEGLRRRKKMPQSMRYLKNKRAKQQADDDATLGKRRPAESQFEQDLQARKTKDNSLDSAGNRSAIKDEDEDDKLETQKTKQVELSSADRHSTQASDTQAGMWPKELQRQADYGGRSFTFRWKDTVDVTLDEEVRVKIVDFGNACWTYKHFTDNIQTREYRSPETILGHAYTANTDLWSLACLVFELLTSDYLFRPHSDKAEPRDEMHLALFISTLGQMPRQLATGGKYSDQFFSKQGTLKHAKLPKTYTIDRILHEEYDFTRKQAADVCDFLQPMLEYDVAKRADAWRMLVTSDWLWTDDDEGDKEAASRNRGRRLPTVLDSLLDSALSKQ